MMKSSVSRNEGHSPASKGMKLIVVVVIALMGSLAPAQTIAGKAAAPASSENRRLERLQLQLRDWAHLGRYRSENAKLSPPAAGVKRVVFYGDSITDFWGRAKGTSFFPGKPYVNRGISGETTPQMLVRFQQDVVHLAPAAVVILAGTNDIADNTGPSTPEMIEDNFVSMAAIAHQSGIKMIISSILPASAYPWKPEIRPTDEIRAVNQWLKNFCQKEGLVYLDYYSAMTNDAGGLPEKLSKDGVHPSPEGYAVMAPLAEKAIAQVLPK